jgi:hypothetical protein
VPALDADQRGDLAGREGPFHVVGGERHDQVRGVRDGHPVDRVDLLHGGHDGGRFRQVGRHVHGPELRAHAAGAQPGDVGVELRPAGREPADVVTRPGPQLHRQVVVAVDHRHRGQRPAHHVRRIQAFTPRQKAARSA